MPCQFFDAYAETRWAHEILGEVENHNIPSPNDEPPPKNEYSQYGTIMSY